MGNYVSDQLMLFLQSILLGAALGLVYDLLSALRRLGGRVWGGALDVLFCLAAASAVFIFVMAGDGELQIFIVLGIVGGAVLFRCLLSGLLRPIWAFWLGLALLPVRLLEEIFKKCGRRAKKSCTFLKKWVTIRINILRKSHTAEQQGGDEDLAATSNGKPARTPGKKAKPVKTGGKLTFFLLILLLAGISVQIFHMFDELQDARAEEAVYAQQLAELQTTNDKLKEDLDNAGNLDLIEDIARDQLGMVRDGEKIFHFSK